MLDMTTLLPILIAALFLVLVVFFLKAGQNRDKQKLLEERVLQARKQGVQAMSKEDFHLFEAEHERLLELKLDEFFKDLAKNRGVQTGYFQRLTAGISAGTAILTLVCAILVSMVGISLLMALPLLDVFPYAVPAGVVLTIIAFRKYQDRRERDFLITFPLAFDIVARGLRAGATLEKTFKTVSDQIKGPVSREFNRIIEEMEFGVPFEEAMVNSAGRIQIDDFSFFAIALIIQRKAGGSLSDLVANISTFLRKRQELREKVKALSAEAKATGLIVGSLPILVLAVMYYINPETIDILRYDPSGRKLSLFLICYMATGIWIMKRMTSIKV